MRSKWIGWFLLSCGVGLSACPAPNPTGDGGDAAPTDVQSVDRVEGGYDVADVQLSDAVDVLLDTPDVTDTGTPDDVPVDAGPAVIALRASHGSSIALTPDDLHAVAVNRAAGSVSFFAVDPVANTIAAAGTPLSLGAADVEPWHVVISPDGATAFVIERQGQRAVRINNITTTPALGASAATGSEPTGMALSPTGALLYVSNWAQGTLTVIRTSDMTVTSTIDLNATLASSGLLGAGLAARPGIAHPRAIVITNNRDSSDMDETAYVTEFFAQRIPTVAESAATADVSWQGLVYRIPLATNTPGAIITLAPFTDTGFVDSAGATTGCFPNQLFDLQVNNGRLYVAAECTSPRGPVGPILAADNTLSNPANFRTQLHGEIAAIDLTTNLEVHAQSVLLNRALDAQYTARAVADDGTNRRMPLLPHSFDFAAGSAALYTAGYGSNAVFRVEYAPATGAFVTVGTASSNFIRLDLGGALNGVDPIGVATGYSHLVLLTNNEFTRNVSLVALPTQGVAAATSPSPPATPAVLDADRIRVGRHFFVTGGGRWSFRGQGWNSCEGCHPNGQTDNTTWYFPRGPRQTISLAGTYNKADPTDQRILNWTGIFDEVHDFEGNVRGNSGGVGALVAATSTPPVAGDRIFFDGVVPTGTAAGRITTNREDGLNGSARQIGDASYTPAFTPKSVIDDWVNVDRYVQTIRSPRGAVTGTGAGFLSAADVTAGRAVFIANNCQGCHGGGKWTVSRRFYNPNDTINDRTSTVSGAALISTLFTTTNWPSAVLPGGTDRHLRLAPFAAGTDQIQCVIRNVGTFNTMAATGLVLEVRSDMTTAAQGALGYNPPSLVGTVTGGPFLHAGNARSLEELLSSTFSAHHQAFSALFNPDTDTTARNQLIAFLLSIDETTTVIPTPAMLPGSGGMFNPTLCPSTFP